MQYLVVLEYTREGEEQRREALVIDNLPSFIQNGCVVCTIKTEKGTWTWFWAALEDAQQDGLILLYFWLEGNNGCSVWRKTNSVRLNHNTMPTLVHRCLFQLCHNPNSSFY
jgi:hypothetical protein